MRPFVSGMTGGSPRRACERYLSSYDGPDMITSSFPRRIAYLQALDDAHSPLVSRLRWRVLNAFGETDVGANLASSLRTGFPLALTLPYGEINDTMILLDRPDELSRRQRPPETWRNMDLWAYTRELTALTTRIGLSGPRAWSSTSGEPSPIWIDWVPLMHAYLRHSGTDDESRDSWLRETVDTSVTADRHLPWADAPLRGRGRPRSDDEALLSVLAACVGRALADPNWTSIATFAHETFNVDFTGGVLKIRCGRLAERMDVFKKL